MSHDHVARWANHAGIDRCTVGFSRAGTLVACIGAVTAVVPATQDQCTYTCQGTGCQPNGIGIGDGGALRNRALVRKLDGLAASSGMSASAILGSHPLLTRS